MQPVAGGQAERGAQARVKSSSGAAVRWLANRLRHRHRRCAGGSGCGWLRSSSNAGGRMVAPRADRIQIGFQLRVVEIRRRSLARQLHVPVRVQRLHHHHADAERIDAGPRLRLVVQQRNSGGSESWCCAMKRFTPRAYSSKRRAVGRRTDLHKSAAPYCETAARAAPCRASPATNP